MSNPGRKHWEVVKNIFRYLWGVEDPQLTFTSDNLTKVEGYMDSDYVGNQDNRKSTFGYVFTYGGGAISWRSKLQECTTRSTTKDDYIVVLEIVKDAIWLHRQSINFSAKSQIDHSALTGHCDSQSTIHLIRNPIYHAKTKHIEVWYHHIRELVTEKKLEVRKIDTKVNIANSLTKPL